MKSIDSFVLIHLVNLLAALLCLRSTQQTHFIKANEFSSEQQRPNVTAYCLPISRTLHQPYIFDRLSLIKAQFILNIFIKTIATVCTRCGCYCLCNQTEFKSPHFFRFVLFFFPFIFIRTVDSF